MLGYSIRGATNTNHLEINIPDQLKGIELQIIILPVVSEATQIEFFSADELQKISGVHIGNPIIDIEDYSKW